MVEPIALALEQERRVSEQINALAATAREEGDFTSEQFVQWFIREQIEEVATMSNLLRVAERSRADQADIEDFIAREHAGGGSDRPLHTPPGQVTHAVCGSALNRSARRQMHPLLAALSRGRVPTLRFPLAGAHSSGRSN